MPKLTIKTIKRPHLTENIIFIKTLTGSWKEAEFKEILNYLKPSTKPFSAEEKKELPLFGINKISGATSNEERRPAKRIVLEIDIPANEKAKIRKGDKKVYEKWSNFFIDLFLKLKVETGLQYYLCYLTPSLCGMRFVLELEKPVCNHVQYKAAVLVFLKALSKYGVDETFYDIRINQGWYVPTFKDYTDLRKATTILPSHIFSLKEPVRFIYPLSTEKDLPVHQKVAKAILDFLIETKQSITTTYPEYLRTGFALADTFSGSIGEDLFHKFSKLDEGRYDSDHCEEQWIQCMKHSTQGRTPFIVLIQEAVKKGFKLSIEMEIELGTMRFWTGYSKKVEIKEIDFQEFLTKAGFFRLENRIDRIIRANNNIINEVSIDDLAGYLSKYIYSYPFNCYEGLTPEIVLNILMKKFKLILTNVVPFLPILPQPKPLDQKKSAWIVFKNTSLFLEKGEPYKIIPLCELPGTIWQSGVIERDFNPNEDGNESEFQDFLKKVCKKDKFRYKFMCTVLGYLVHKYKDPSLNHAIVFLDEEVGRDGRSEGGTGKSLVVIAIKEFLNSVVYIDGKSFSIENRFKYQRIKQGDRVVVIEDLKRDIDFDGFFSSITDGLSVEAKHCNEIHIPYNESPKFLFTTNRPLLGSGGGSEERRKVNVLFSNYFNVAYTPQNEYGHLLFKDWDALEWNRFDNFMISCLQLFLDIGIVKYKPESYKMIEFSARTSDEFFKYSARIHQKKLYNKNIIFHDFIEAFHCIEVKQRTFTKWLRDLADFKGWEVSEHKSNGKSCIKFH
jgi:hypothetical protein